MTSNLFFINWSHRERNRWNNLSNFPKDGGMNKWMDGDAQNDRQIDKHTGRWAHIWKNIRKHKRVHRSTHWPILDLFTPWYTCTSSILCLVLYVWLLYNDCLVCPLCSHTGVWTHYSTSLWSVSLYTVVRICRYYTCHTSLITSFFIICILYLSSQHTHYF